MFYNKGRTQEKVVLCKEGKNDKVYPVCSVSLVEWTYFVFTFC